MHVNLNDLIARVVAAARACRAAGARRARCVPARGLPRASAVGAKRRASAPAGAATCQCGGSKGEWSGWFPCVPSVATDDLAAEADPPERPHHPRPPTCRRRGRSGGSAGSAAGEGLHWVSHQYSQSCRSHVCVCFCSRRRIVVGCEYEAGTTPGQGGTRSTCVSTSG